MSGQEMVLGNALVGRLVELRDAAMAEAEAAARLLCEADALMQSASEKMRAVTKGYRPETDRDADRAFQNLTRGVVGGELEAFRKKLDGGGWLHLFSASGMGSIMDAQGKEGFRASIEGDVPTFDLPSIRATFQALMENREDHFLRGVANAFSALDRRFKSHDAFRFKHRVVFEGVFDQWGFLNVTHSVFDRLLDVYRVFRVLDGGTPPSHSEICELLREGRERGKCQSVVETEYFKIRTWMNGNVHLYFSNKPLLDRVNQALAKFYGAVLPDAVGGAEAPKVGTALAKDLQFYPTPAKVAKEAARHIGHAFYGSDPRVLEPSAGEGALIDALKKVCPQARVDAVEVHAGRAEQLQRRHPDANVRQANFLALDIEPGLYDAVLMNPPFYGTHWIEHIAKAVDCLRPGGKLVAILPATAQIGEQKKQKGARQWLGKVGDYRFFSLPVGAFAESGTNVSTVVLSFTKNR